MKRAAALFERFTSLCGTKPGALWAGLTIAAALVSSLLGLRALFDLTPQHPVSLLIGLTQLPGLLLLIPLDHVSDELTNAVLTVGVYAFQGCIIGAALNLLCKGRKGSPIAGSAGQP